MWNGLLNILRLTLIRTAIIYTRTDSKRLKNKALIKVYKNKSLIESVVENTLKIKSINKVIIATTKSKNDLIFSKILKKYKINFFYGSTNDLINRTINCSKKYNFNYFLRVCGDRPFFSYNYINNTIIKLNKKNNNYDLISNNKLEKKVDQGLTVEIISAKSLQKLTKIKTSKYNKENLTSYFYNNQNKFKIFYLNSPKNWFLNNKYTIDTKKDLKKMKYIISNIGYNKFNIKKCIKLYNN